MTTDLFTTREYYKYWQNVSEIIESLNKTMINETRITNSFFQGNFSWGYFILAIAIWTLTPLAWTFMIYPILMNLMFNWEKYNLDYTTNEQQIVIKLLRIFGLTQEKVHLFPTYLKLLVMFVPPLGMVTFIIVMLYAAFLCYVQFPLFAIRVALENIYKELSERSRAKMNKAYGKHETILTMLSKGKKICGLEILNEGDISRFKVIEALHESFFQLFLSLFYFMITERYDPLTGFPVGNRDEENLYTQKNSIVLASMYLSLGTILIANCEYHVNQLKLAYGKDFYARLCLMSKGTWFNAGVFFVILPIVLIFYLIAFTACDKNLRILI